MASFSLKLPAQAAVVAASSLTLTGCMSMGGNSSAHAPSPVSNPCGTTTCSAPVPEPPPKKGLLGLCSHDKNREGLLAKLTGHNKTPQPTNGSPVPLAPGEFIVAYNQGPPPMYAAPVCPPPACPSPVCSTPVSACPPEPCFSSGGLMPSISSIMPAPSAPCATPPTNNTVVPNAVLPPAPVTGQPPLAAPSTVAPPSGVPGMVPGGTPQAQPQPAPGTTTSKSFLR